jgi:hypothetical protein
MLGTTGYQETIHTTQNELVKISKPTALAEAGGVDPQHMQTKNSYPNGVAVKTTINSVETSNKPLSTRKYMEHGDNSLHQPPSMEHARLFLAGFKRTHDDGTINGIQKKRHVKQKLDAPPAVFFA